jgi:hypothetical protein
MSAEVHGLATDEIAGTTNIGVRAGYLHSKHSKMLTCMAVIVYKNGRSGFLGEHSCIEGTPTLCMNEFVSGSLALRKADLGPPMSISTGMEQSLLVPLLLI